MSAYALMLPDASVRGDAFASGEPDEPNAWVIVPFFAGPERDARIRTFDSPAEAWEWRRRRIAHQRAQRKGHRHPVVVRLSEAQP
jgi:hypothetical protein